MTLLQGDSVPRDHSLVECESGFRAIALDEFSDRMIIGSRGTGRYQAVPTEIPDSGKGKVRYSHERALICERGKCLLANGCHCRFHVIVDSDLRFGSAEIGPRAVDVQGEVFDLKDLDRLVAAIRAKGIWWKCEPFVVGSPRPAFSTGNAHWARIRIRPTLRPGRIWKSASSPVEALADK